MRQRGTADCHHRDAPLLWFDWMPADPFEATTARMMLTATFPGPLTALMPLPLRIRSKKIRPRLIYNSIFYERQVRFSKPKRDAVYSETGLRFPLDCAKLP